MGELKYRSGQQTNDDTSVLLRATDYDARDLHHSNRGSIRTLWYGMLRHNTETVDRLLAKANHDAQAEALTRVLTDKNFGSELKTPKERYDYHIALASKVRELPFTEADDALLRRPVIVAELARAAAEATSVFGNPDVSKKLVAEAMGIAIKNPGSIVEDEHKTATTLERELTRHGMISEAKVIRHALKKYRKSRFPGQSARVHKEPLNEQIHPKAETIVPLSEEQIRLKHESELRTARTKAIQKFVGDYHFENRTVDFSMSKAALVGIALASPFLLIGGAYMANDVSLYLEYGYNPAKGIDPFVGVPIPIAFLSMGAIIIATALLLKKSDEIGLFVSINDDEFLASANPGAGALPAGSAPFKLVDLDNRSNKELRARLATYIPACNVVTGHVPGHWEDETRPPYSYEQDYNAAIGDRARLIVTRTRWVGPTDLRCGTPLSFSSKALVSEAQDGAFVTILRLQCQIHDKGSKVVNLFLPSLVAKQ